MNTSTVISKYSPLLLAGSVILCLLIGAAGSVFTITGPGSWYALLIKPSFNPPNWIFGPVWTTLYILMGISLYLVLREWKKGVDIRIAGGLFTVQLFLNFIWSYMFFGLQSPSSAFIVIVLLWVAILATIITFFRINRISAYLLVPYILWVSFASILNYSIMVLNP
jgi:Tryptophan-rich sensory protein (mitochondrial benzodiazepine receptor homolog)